VLPLSTEQKHWSAYYTHTIPDHRWIYCQDHMAVPVSRGTKWNTKIYRHRNTYQCVQKQTVLLQADILPPSAHVTTPTPPIHQSISKLQAHAHTVTNNNHTLTDHKTMWRSICWKQQDALELKWWTEGCTMFYVKMTPFVCKQYGKPQTTGSKVLLGVKPLIPQIQSRSAP
jgi:hypothetical protein